MGWIYHYDITSTTSRGYDFPIENISQALSIGVGHTGGSEGVWFPPRFDAKYMPDVTKGIPFNNISLNNSIFLQPLGNMSSFSGEIWIDKSLIVL